MIAGFRWCAWIGDRAALVALHVLLYSLLLGAVCMQRRLPRPRDPDLTVNRGQLSMGILAAVYASASIAVTLAIDVADFMRGYKSTVILIDYLALTYLFFFNPWFKNRVLNIANRATKDD